MKGMRTIAPMGVRIPDELKEKVSSSARENGRSMNAEIVSIIERSFTEGPSQDIASLKEIISHLQQIIALKDQIIASNEGSISSQRETIHSMERTIATLEEHNKILELQLKGK